MTIVAMLLSEVAITQHPQRLVREVVRQVVARSKAVDGKDRVAFDQFVRLVQIGEAVEEAIELVEAALQRP